MIYGVYLLRKILKLEFYTSSYKVCYVYVLCTPEYPHDPEDLCYPPHLVLVLVGAPAPTPHARGGQQAQDQRGEVGEDPQQVDDVHTALDEPGHHGMDR